MKALGTLYHKCRGRTSEGDLTAMISTVFLRPFFYIKKNEAAVGYRGFVLGKTMSDMGKS